MDKKAKEFLFKLLETHSPSGDEAGIQRIWLDYVKQFAQVDTDPSGNAYGILNPDAKFRVMISGHCDEIAMMVTRIDDEGFVRFTASGGIDPELLPGSRVDILNEKKIVSGMIGYTKDKKGNFPEKPKCEDFYIDCCFRNGKEAKKQVQIGDYILYRSRPEIINDHLICKGLDDKTGAFIVAEAIRRLSRKKIKIGVFAVSTTGEETNLRGAFYAAARIKPDMGIACDVTYSQDTPGESDNSPYGIELGKGSVLAKGSPVNVIVNKLLEKAAKKARVPLQYELTPMRTCTDGDLIQFSGEGVPIGLLSLPLRYMHSPIEVASLKDMEAEINILVELLSSMTGKEDLRPVRP